MLGATVAWILVKRRESTGATGAPIIERPRAMGDEAPAPIPVDKPVPAAAGTEAPLDIVLEAVRMSVSLVNATLHYRLRLTNHSPAAIGPIALALDMIGAHASLSDESQLALDGAGLELRHEVPALAPGESTELRGELRLPLAQVTPIRSGGAALLVPLVRLRAEAGDISLSRALVVGETPAAPGGPLRPFRLDQGPRIFGAVSQRQLAAA